MEILIKRLLWTFVILLVIDLSTSDEEPDIKFRLLVCNSSRRCKCELGRYYCADEIASLGWTEAQETPNNVYICTKSGPLEHPFCSMCASKDSRPLCQDCNSTKSECDPECQPSRCACQSTLHYCGQELMDLGWVGLDNNTIYECDGRTKVKTVQQCQTKCRLLRADSVCDGECAKGTSYCGWRLRQLGYFGFKNDSLYRCDDGRTDNMVETGDRHIFCTGECIRDSRYCGYEVQYTKYVAPSDLQRVHLCKYNKTVNLVEFSTLVPMDGACGKCVASESGYVRDAKRPGQMTLGDCEFLVLRNALVLIFRYFDRSVGRCGLLLCYGTLRLQTWCEVIA